MAIERKKKVYFQAKKEELMKWFNDRLSTVLAERLTVKDVEDLIEQMNRLHLSTTSRSNDDSTIQPQSGHQSGSSTIP